MVLALEKSGLKKWNVEQMLDLLSQLEEPLRSGGSGPNIRYLSSRDILARIHILKCLYRKSPEELIKAEEVVQEVLAFNNKNTTSYQLLAEIRMIQGHPDEAINFLKKRLEINNNLIKFHKSLGVLYLKVGDKQKGAAALKKSIELGYVLGGFDLSFILKVGRLYEEQGDYKMALDVYEKARDYWENLEESREDKVLSAKMSDLLSQLYIALANAYFKLGDKEKAYQAAEKVLDIDPTLKYQIEEFLRTIEP